MRDVDNGAAILRDIAAGLTATAGQERLTAVVECLAGVLDVLDVFVGEILADSRLQVVAASSGAGGRLPLGAYLPGPVWETIVERSSFSCPDGFGRRHLADMGPEMRRVEGFLARTLGDPSGAPVGLLGILDRCPLRPGKGADALLSLFALPAEIELNRRRSQRALSRAARQWAAIVDTMPEFVAVVGTDYRILRGNLALARFANLHPRELVGRRCHEVLHGLPVPWPDCPHELALRTGRSFTQEVDDPHVGQPLSVSCTPLFSEGGGMVGTVHIARVLSGSRPAPAERGAGAAPDGADTLRRLLAHALPMCAGCKKVRHGDGRWHDVDVFLRDQAGATITHGVCPECARLLYPGHLQT